MGGKAVVAMIACYYQQCWIQVNRIRQKGSQYSHEMGFDFGILQAKSAYMAPTKSKFLSVLYTENL